MDNIAHLLYLKCISIIIGLNIMVKLVHSTLLLLLLTACTNQSQGNGSYISHGEQNSAKSREIVVRLCPDTGKTEAKQQLKQLNLLLLKKSSPTIWTLRWLDNRTVEQVITSLKGDASRFCMAQPNYRYKTQ